MDHPYFMGLALEEARLAFAKGEVPVGAVLVSQSGIVLARAHNQPVSSRDPTAHAEILALRRAAGLLRNYRLPGTILYVTLEPCAMCLGAAMQARVEMVVFGARDPKAGAMGGVVDLTNLGAFPHSIQAVHGVRDEECARMLVRFFRERRSLKSGACGEVPKWS
ncbi:tRNA adenosine(34) deaminase TadA [Desulfacinum hydrothermale]|uniref:tRNA adenosine(34) deaminase TadA n=1 Tax=Desulfacinum hydrothermale TaxID=109258 RepID=UPI001BAF5256|nr:tRNA adenosine(34) deaminase TadA [Desulfacinum hydrothermale]